MYEPLRDALTFLVVLLLVVYPLVTGLQSLEYNWRWDQAWDTIVWRDTQGGWRTGALLKGLWLTIQVSTAAILLALPLGVAAGLARVSPNRGLRAWSAIYVELIRNTPLLVQILFAYYVLGRVLDGLFGAGWIGIESRAFVMGGLALACFSGAYLCEIVRAGIESIDRGQVEAARALGLSRRQAMRHVVLPQAFRRSLPPMAGQFISLVKDSSLLMIVGVVELVKSADDQIGRHLASLETWTLVALLYLCITFPLSLAVQWIEARLARAD